AYSIIESRRRSRVLPDILAIFAEEPFALQPRQSVLNANLSLCYFRKTAFDQGVYHLRICSDPFSKLDLTFILRAVLPQPLNTSQSFFDGDETSRPICDQFFLFHIFSDHVLTKLAAARKTPSGFILGALRYLP